MMPVPTPKPPKLDPTPLLSREEMETEAALKRLRGANRRDA
jgi:hypothetical protein